MILVVLLLAVLVAVDAHDLPTLSPPVQREYNLLFGNFLHQTFASNFTLNQAVLQKKARISPTQPDLRYACATYETGAVIAAQSRKESLNNLIPVLVDKNENIMCFLQVKSSQKDLDDFSALEILPFPEALKIHDSLLDLIYNGRGLQFADFLIMSFRQEFFSVDPYAFNTSIETLVVDHLKDIASVPSREILNTFFWTSRATTQFFDGISEQQIDTTLAIDRQHHLRWVELLTPFENGSNDVCKLATLWKYVEYDAGVLKFHLNKYFASLKQSDIVSCLSLLIAHLSLLYFVNHLALQRSPELLNFRARSIPQTAQVGSDLLNMPYTAAGLMGDGQVVAIADTGVDSFSCFFYDPQGQVSPHQLSSPFYDNKYRKIIQYLYNSCGDTSDGAGGHGTHVSGTAVGCIAGSDISSSGMYNGVAPNAKLSFTDLGKPGTGLCIPPVNQLFGPGFQASSRVFSNSWGSSFTGSGYYAGQNTDAYLFQTQSIAIFFAAGNSGGNGDGVRTITMEGSSKNVITVGSSETTLGSSDISNVAFYSSKGPTYDNRFKPDIVSPGDGLMSANAAGSGSATCSTIQMTGTSMATPAAAGIALLVRQYFMDPNSKFWTAVCNRSYRSCKSFSPSGPLVKAILVHSGRKMKLFDGGGSYDVLLGSPPDNIQGFGRVSLFQVLPLKDWLTSFDLFVADSVNIPENDDVTYIVNIASSDIPLKATLVWYDPPTVQGSTAKALINDLDILAISPSGQRFYPNKLSSPDSLNTVERLNITSPATGPWKIVVTSDALPVMGNQLFSLVITSMGSVSYG